MVWHLISHIFSSCLQSIQDAAAFPLDALAAIHKCDADTKAVFQAGPGHGIHFFHSVLRRLWKPHHIPPGAGAKFADHFLIRF